MVVVVGCWLTPLSDVFGDDWGALWSTGLLEALDLAWLDRDAKRVLELSSSLDPESSIQVRVRVKLLEGLAAKREGDNARSIRALMEVERLCAVGLPEDLKLAPYARYQRVLALLSIGGEDARKTREILEQLRRHKHGLPGFDLQLARAYLADGDPGAALAHLAEINPGRGHDLFAR